jgi:hypothetical protein
MSQVDSSLEQHIFDQAADGVIGKSGDDCGIQLEATTEAAGDVVFTSAFPGTKMASSGDAVIAGIEAKHDFAEGHQVPPATSFRLDFQFCHDLHIL